MARLARKYVFALAAVSFVAMTTGLTMQLHLLSHEHSQENESDNCSVCRKLIAPSKFAAVPELKLDDVEQFEYCVGFRTHSYVTISCPESFNPRPPPSIL